MPIVVVAKPRAEFDAWLRRKQTAATEVAAAVTE
jgi:heme/copper-type cytochrome/quinol oxidase subunit 2